MRFEPESSTDIAADLLSMAMRDSEMPVMAMAAALARIRTLLTRPRGETAATPHSAHEALIESDISICIESLQFHDRLIQQLTTVRRLMGLDAAEGAACSGFMPRGGSVELF